MTGSNNEQPRTEASQDQQSDVVDSSGWGRFRRELLAGIAIGSGIIGSVVVLNGSESEDAPGEETNDKLSALTEREIEYRSRAYEQRPSLTPEFDYAPVSESFDEPEESVTRIDAAPIGGANGDRLVFALSEETASPTLEFVVGYWTDPDDSYQYETQLDEDVVTFDVYRGSTVTVGTAERAASGSEGVELLVARGSNRDATEQAIDEFEEVL